MKMTVVKFGVASLTAACIATGVAAADQAPAPTPQENEKLYGATDTWCPRLPNSLSFDDGRKVLERRADGRWVMSKGTDHNRQGFGYIDHDDNSRKYRFEYRTNREYTCKDKGDRMR